MRYPVDAIRNPGFRPTGENEMKTFEQQYYEAPSFWKAGAVKTERLSRIEQLLPEKFSNMLDVGCGNGAWGHHLKKGHPDVEIVGVDRSQTALDNVTFRKVSASVDELPFEDKEFDVVSCLQVIEHLNVPTYEKALDEMARVAANMIIIEVPYRENIIENRTDCPRCGTSFNIDLHINSFDDEKLEKLFAGRGFRLKRKIFPDQKQHLFLIDKLISDLKNMGREKPGFLSPICPLCGYTEGDRTVISLVEDHENRPRNTSSLRKLIKSTIDKHWPKITVTGYSVACVYER